MKIKKLIVPLAATGALLLSACCCLGPALVYPAPDVTVPETPPAPLSAKQLPSGCIAWLQAPPRGAPVIVWCHGNGENLETMRQAAMFEDFRRLGVGVVAVDYPGYGNSPGRTTEKGARQSVIEAVALARRTWPQHKMILAAWSIGTGIAMAAMDDVDVDGLVLVSPFTTLAAVGHEHYPAWLVGLVLPDTYDSLAMAPTLKTRTLVVHGTADPIIPERLGRQLAQKIPDCRYVSLGGTGHVAVADSRFWRELSDFVRSIR